MSMSVGELIERLQKFDRDLEVAVVNQYGYLDAIDNVYEEDLPDEMNDGDEPVKCVAIV